MVVDSLAMSSSTVSANCSWLVLAQPVHSLPCCQMMGAWLCWLAMWWQDGPEPQIFCWDLQDTHVWWTCGQVVSSQSVGLGLRNVGGPFTTVLLDTVLSQYRFSWLNGISYSLVCLRFCKFCLVWCIPAREWPFLQEALPDSVLWGRKPSCCSIPR